MSRSIIIFALINTITNLANLDDKLEVLAGFGRIEQCQHFRCITYNQLQLGYNKDGENWNDEEHFYRMGIIFIGVIFKAIQLEEEITHLSYHSYGTYTTEPTKGYFFLTMTL